MSDAILTETQNISLFTSRASASLHPLPLSSYHRFIKALGILLFFFVLNAKSCLLDDSPWYTIMRLHGMARALINAEFAMSRLFLTYVTDAGHGPSTGSIKSNTKAERWRGWAEGEIVTGRAKARRFLALVHQYAFFTVVSRSFCGDSVRHVHRTLGRLINFPLELMVVWDSREEGVVFLVHLPPTPPHPRPCPSPAPGPDCTQSLTADYGASRTWSL